LKELITDSEAVGKRLDAWLSARLAPDLSRNRIQSLIGEGQVSIDGKVIREAKHKLREGSNVAIAVPEPEDATPKGEEIALDILYEDKDLIVINKPASLVVHPGNGNWSGTLVNALIHHCGDTLSGIGGVKRPGIVHRLDKETSGVMVVAKNDLAHEEREDARHAVTHFDVQEKFGAKDDATALAALIECRLETGRTHQIRVHMAHIGHPLVGDLDYGSAYKTKANKLAEPLQGIVKRFSRQALHARLLAFEHPATGEIMHFEAPVPDDMAELLDAFRTTGL
jgi:23S rRNA pseudouridine1911/1915/1917 synthase